MLLFAGSRRGADWHLDVVPSVECCCDWSCLVQFLIGTTGKTICSSQSHEPRPVQLFNPAGSKADVCRITSIISPSLTSCTPQHSSLSSHRQQEVRANASCACLNKSSNAMKLAPVCD